MATLKGNNVNRAKWAKVAFDVFVDVVDTNRTNDDATNLGDFLSDLMHLSEAKDIDIEQVWEKAQEDYLYERENPHE